MEYHRARLQYQFKKLRQIREGIYPEHGGNIEFELFGFFEICYHLKDWVKHSPECASFSSVEQFISQSPPLRICGDICNRLKHKILTRKRRSKSELGIFKLRSTTTIGLFPSRTKVSLDEAKIVTERGEECCFALAEECIDEWDRYFSENGIPLSYP